MFRLLAALGSDFGIPFVLCLGCRVRRDGKAPGLVTWGPSQQWFVLLDLEQRGDLRAVKAGHRGRVTAAGPSGGLPVLDELAAGAVVAQDGAAGGEDVDGIFARATAATHWRRLEALNRGGAGQLGGAGEQLELQRDCAATLD